MCTGRSEAGPPSVITARRAAEDGAARARRERAYPRDAGYDDHLAVQARLDATRALLTATGPRQVAAIAATLVHDLGGGLVPARLADVRAMPLDVSLGTGEPLLPWAEPVSVAGMRLTAVLPRFIEDARAVLQRLQAEQRQAQEAELDGLTGLLTRRAWMRRLGQAGQGDAVARIALDVQAGNDGAGHATGDDVLRAVGLLLRRHLRTEDTCGRYGGDEVACLAPGMPAEALAARLDAVRPDWVVSRPGAAPPVGLAIGVAAVGPGGPRAALQAADRALDRANAAGRDRTELATAEDAGGTAP